LLDIRIAHHEPELMVETQFLNGARVS